MRLTAIVPATDGPSTIARCVAAIEHSDQPPEQLIVITEPAGAGPAAARNAGARQANGELLVFVDADVEVHPDALGRLRTAFASEPGLVAMFGAYDDAPAAPGVVSGFRNLLHHHEHVRGAGRVPTFWAGLGAIRRDAFLECGGFDEHRYPRASIEDIELGARLSRRGAEIVLDPGLQGKHLKAWTLRSMIETDLRRRGIPWVALMLRERTAPATLNLGWRHRASAALCVAGASFLVAGRPRGALAAVGGLVWLNRSLYALLLRRMGPTGAVAGVGLHAVHHLTAAAAVPLGAMGYLREVGSRTED